MKLITRLFAAIAMLSMTLGAKSQTVNLLPKPQEMTVGGAAFTLGGEVRVTNPTGNVMLQEFLTENGFTANDNASRSITVSIVAAIDGAYDYTLAGFDNEAYTLSVTADAIDITALNNTGVCRAAATLMQLAGNGSIEGVSIKDWPAFKLRGYMHDVGRSFITVEELKNEIKKFARFKVNCFHWHLTENQAWRFEVQAYPQLTSSSSMTRFAGQYYTQAECREIDQLCHDYGVVLIPELDMPGHSAAFERAMGHNMQTDEGVAELQAILEEAAGVFTHAPYIHIGGDEVTITRANFLQDMIAKVKSLGKKAVVWNPINGVNVSGLDADMVQCWGTRGTKISGKANIDCRYNYTNHFDVFADLAGIYLSNILYESRGNAEVAGELSCPWNDRKTPTQEDIIKQNNHWANVIASASRAWIGGGEGYIETQGAVLPNSGSQYDDFCDWERRFLHWKSSAWLAGEPIPYVKQADVRWRITDMIPSTDADQIDPTATPQDLITIDELTYGTRIVTGAGIYLNHTWGTTVPGIYPGAAYGNTVYAWTYVYSPVAQDAGALIEFYNYGRSENDAAAAAGQWDKMGSRIWLNDTELTAPSWQNAGRSVGAEVDLQDENFTARAPYAIHLNEGWNKVFIKLPYTSASYRLHKWMWTFVVTDVQGRNALDGLTYSPSQSADDEAASLSLYISEVETDVNSKVGDRIGDYAQSNATEIRALIAEIKATLTTPRTAAERAAQRARIETAYAAFTASCTDATINLPVSSKWYSLKSKRGNKYLACGNADAVATSGTALDETGCWKFVKRADGTFNIISRNSGLYLTPTDVKTKAAEPAAGWTIKRSAESGYVIVVSGSDQLHQGNSGILNWGSGTNTTDEGCKYIIAEATRVPLSSIEASNSIESHYYYMYTPNRGNRYPTAKGAGQAVVGETTVTDAAAWKFVLRADGTYDIVNYTDGTYISPASNYNTALNTVTARPTAGWSLQRSGGYWLIYSGTTAQFNQTNNSNQGFKVYNWGNQGTVNTTDTGCQYVIVDADVEVDAGYTKIEINSSTGTFNNPTGSYHSSWTSTAQDPSVSITVGKNNMNYVEGHLQLYTNQEAGACQYNITAQAGWAIAGFCFTGEPKSETAIPVTLPDGSSVTIPATGSVFIDYKAPRPQQTLSFSITGAAKFVLARNFVVYLVPVDVTSSVPFVYDRTAAHNVTYRIPSIASIPVGEHKGRIVAFTDYRPGGADVGVGEVDIHCRYSDDYGLTWGEEIKIVDGEWNSSKGARWYSFGDPVSIADRETGKLLMVSCSGNIRYQVATRDNHQGVEVFWSEDGGATWTEPVDKSEQLYNALPNAPSLFIGSGGFVQSKFVKKGSHYRVYGGILVRDNAKNYIVYTDDFGQTWNVLGGADAYSLTGGDEAKAEELPDGSVLQSSRLNGGRIFNIWRWDDDTYTTGHWETQANSNSSNNGIVANGNSTNGEILIVPAKRKSDDQSVYLALQSIPFGSGRANVGIYYKELTSLASFADPATFAAGWTKGKQVSLLSSAYSAMVLQENGNVGFLVEEGTYGVDFSQVYHNLSYEDITGDRYTYIAENDADFDRSAFDVQRGYVDYNLKWNGVLQRTVRAGGYYGESLPAPTLPDFTEATNLPTGTLDATTNGSTYDVDVVWNGPVQLSTEGDMHYYYIKLKNANWIIDENPGQKMVVTNTSYTAADRNAMWAFMGNPFESLQIVNGNGRVLASATSCADGNTGGNTFPVTKPSDEVGDLSTRWELRPSTYYTDGFFVYNIDCAAALNHRSPNLAYWNGGADAGSTFNATLVPDRDLAPLALLTEIYNSTIPAVHETNPACIYSEELAAALATAKALIDANSIDMAAIDAATEALNTALTGITSDNPFVVGKWYQFISHQKNGNEYILIHEDSQTTANVANVTGIMNTRAYDEAVGCSEEGSYYLCARRLDDGRLVFVNGKYGDYMTIQSVDSDVYGCSDIFAESYCGLKVTSTFGAANMPTGYVRIFVTRRSASKDKDGTMNVKKDGTFDGYGGEVFLYHDNYSSLFRVKGVSGYCNNLNRVTFRTPKDADGHSYASFYANYPVQLPADATAYVCDEAGNGRMHLEAIEGDIVPALTPVVIRGPETLGAETLSVALMESNPAIATNLLLGTLVQKTATELLTEHEATGQKVYGLSGAFGKIGFFLNAPTAVMTAGRAFYIADPAQAEASQSNASVRGFTFDPDNGTATGLDITGAIDATQTGDAYDLTGRRVGTVKKNHIYIINGQKTLVR